MRLDCTVKVVVILVNVNSFLIITYSCTEVLCFSNSHLSSTKNEKIIEQQLLVDQLNEELTKLNLSMTSSAKENCGDEPDARIPEKRPYTVPFDTHFGYYIHIPARQDSRKVKSKN
jgi:hypothetical protein